MLVPSARIWYTTTEQRGTKDAEQEGERRDAIIDTSYISRYVELFITHVSDINGRYCHELTRNKATPQPKFRFITL